MDHCGPSGQAPAGQAAAAAAEESVARTAAGAAGAAGAAPAGTAARTAATSKTSGPAAPAAEAAQRSTRSISPPSAAVSQERQAHTGGCDPKGPGRLGKGHKSLKVTTWNAATFHFERAHQFRIFLERHSPDLAIITESELDLPDAAAMVVDGYNVVYDPDTSKVRCLMLIKKSIKYTLIPHLIDQNVPMLWVLLEEYKIMVAGIYRQFTFKGEKGGPAEREQQQIIDKMIRAASEEFAAYSMCLAGDLNFNMQRQGDSSYTRKRMLNNWLELLDSVGLAWAPTERPTYISYASHGGSAQESTLDHIYTTPDLRASSTVSDWAASDHRPVTAVLHTRKSPGISPSGNLQQIISRDFKNANYDKLNNELKAAGVSDWPLPPPGMSPDAMLNDLMVILEGFVKKFVPDRLIKVRRDTPHLLLSKETIAAISSRDKARRKGKTSQYKALRNKACRLVKKDRIRTACKRLQKAGNPQAAAWKLARAVLKPPERRPLLADTKSEEESAEKCNNFYINKVEHLCHSFSRDSVTRAGVLGSVDGKNSTPTFDLHCIGLSTLKKAVRGLRSTDALGVDGLPTIFWKQCLPSLALPLLRLINLSIKEKTFPTAWKDALISPALKKGKDPSLAASWRPVAILPAISKVLEQVVHDQLSSFLEENGLLPQEQHGFRKHRSTSTAIASSLHDWAASRKQGNIIGIAAFDFSAAFDTVSPETMMSELQRVGVSLTSLKWFRSFMTGRRQAVVWNGSRSTFLEVKFGVPQGSKLGPLLFIVYTASVAAALRLARIYADDTHTWSVEKNIDSALDKLSTREETMKKFSDALGLALNSDKTQRMIIGAVVKPEEELPADFSNTINLLGFEIDSRLSINPTTLKFKSGLAQRVGASKRLCALLPPHVGRMMVRAFIDGFVAAYVQHLFPVRFGDEPHNSMASSCQIHINDVARAVTKKKRRDHVCVSELLDRSGLSSINHIITKSAGMMAWNAMTLPEHPLRPIFAKLELNTSTRSASSNKLCPLEPAIAERAIAIANAVKVWNNSEELRVAKSRSAAKSVLKKLVRTMPL